MMRISMVMCRPIPNPTRPSVDLSGSHLNMDLLTNPGRPREKLVVILGATGTGKSRLSIEVASRFPAEIVNSDKIQAYPGLDIVTNKVTEAEKCGIPHHLMGTVRDPDKDFSAAEFRDAAGRAIGSIAARGQLPVVVGGSNSYIEALVTGHQEYFYRAGPAYDCCFLWVDVALPILDRVVSERVDRMVQQGLVEEVRGIFDPDNIDYSRGVRRAIGVPELDRYFRTEKYLTGPGRARMLDDAIEEIKHNTRQLARRQLEKIHRLRDTKGWNLHKLDATEVFRKVGEEAEKAWEELVAGPGAAVVAEFLYNDVVLVGGGGFGYDPLSRIRFPIEAPMTAASAR